MRILKDKLKEFPTILIIFGATGDLMERKLLPSIFRLYQKGFLPKMFQVIGFAKEDLTEEEYRNWLRKNLPKNISKPKISDFLQRFFYQPGLFEDLENYSLIGKKLGQVDGKFKTCANKLFYLAVPPNYYETIFKNLAKSGLTKPCSEKEGWTRVLVEKPFGLDRNLNKKLDGLLGKLFKEVQIYRIDHYLAKETIMNLLVFRFANSVFESIWNKNFIEKIEIKLLEKTGVGKRGFFYDHIGALRDVGQNHLLQMLALVTMDTPSNLNSDEIKKKKVELLSSLPKMSKEEIVKNTIRGQYLGYLEARGVRPDSQTETYFKIKTFLDCPRWKGVPIYLETGKKLDQDLVEIVITFRHIASCLFCSTDQLRQYKNTLCFQIQPKEGILYCFFVKKPGPGLEVEKKEFHFLYQEAFKTERILPDYDRLLIDAFLGDQTLFVSTEETLAGWKFIDPILNGWQKNFSPLKIYKPNSLPHHNKN